MRKINVIHICDKFGMRGSTTHGVSRLFAWWFPKFDYSKYNVKLYALKTPDSASRALEAEGVEMTYLGKAKISPSILPTFLRIIREEQADILHLHGWIAANFGRLAGKLTGVPTIMHEHGVDPNFPKSQKTADRLLSGCTHTAVAVSASVRDFMIEHRSVAPDKIRVVYNGAPLDEFSDADPEAVEAARREFGIPAGSPIVGTVGRLDTQKGLTYLIKAVPRILEAFPGTYFMIVGDGPKLGELKQEASQLGVADHIIFTGHRSDVPVVQSLFDIQAFPSLWEGTPLTVFEAMARGRAIVSTTVDGLGEVLTDQESAILVNPANPRQLGEGIISLLSDDSLASRLREGALARSRNYDISSTVRNLEMLYDELATPACRKT